MGATVFNKPYEDRNPKRIIKASNEFAKYNVISENSFLIDNEKERDIILPYSKDDGFGYGQSNIWYANENNEKIITYKNEIVNKIEKIINDIVDDERFNDENKYFEGKINKTIREISNVKRNSKARQKCLDYYFQNNEQYKCKICGFNFEEKYGETVKGFIEVHHIKSHTVLSKKIGQHEIDPINELLPVCSNCHSIIHRGQKPLEIDEIKMLIEKSANGT